MVKEFFRRFIDIFVNKRIPRASAALSYFITMTFFPLIIILYTLLGNNFDFAQRILNFAKNFIALETFEFINEFLIYVSSHRSNYMLISGLIVVLMSSSAAMRSVQATIGEMQGGMRYKGLPNFLFSVLYSIVFIIAIYIGMLIMLFGRRFVEYINGLIPAYDISFTWNLLRYVVLGAIEFFIISGLYEASKRKADRYPTYVGALISTLAIVGVCMFFSLILSYSAKYPVIYGSLAAIILLMFWIYCVALVIYCCADINIVLRDMRRKEDTETETT